MRVDDTLGAGFNIFEHRETLMAEAFQTKEKSVIPFKCNGAYFQFQESKEDKMDAILDHHFHYCSNVENHPSKFASEDFARIRIKLAYVATSTRPDISFYAAKLSQVKSTEVKPEDAKLMSTALKILKVDACSLGN